MTILAAIDVDFVLGVLVALFGLFVVILIVSYTIATLVRRKQAWIYRTNRRPAEYKRALAGEGLDAEQLYKRTGIAADTLRNATPRYTRRAIPKRRGGNRILLVPNDETKLIQQTLLRRLLGKLRAHPAATGFERGRSIVDHARPHVGRGVVVKLDVVDFFPSTTDVRVDAYFRRVGWDADVAELLTKWTTIDGALPQGAPTSPRLSNLVNYYVDVQLATIARWRGCAYTRYADDITLSWDGAPPSHVRGTVQQVGRVLRVHGYALHPKKFKVDLATQRQTVTGLVVNKKVNLPRRTRRWLRAVKHHQATGRPMTITERQLEGWIALERMVELQRNRPS